MVCEGCGRRTNPLKIVDHHWYGVDLQEHHKDVCSGCNTKLTRRNIEKYGYECPMPRSPAPRIQSHFLPDWSIQQLVVQRIYAPERPAKTPTINGKTYHPILADFIIDLVGIFPKFDPTWSQAVQDAWWASFKALPDIRS